MLQRPTASAEWNATLAQRAAILLPLAAAPRCSRATANAAAQVLGLSERQVYHLVRRLRAAQGDPAVLSRAAPAAGRSKPRLAPAAEAMTQAIIAELCQATPEMPVAALAAEVRRRCHAQHVPPPSVSTVRRRLRAARQAHQAAAVEQAALPGRAGWRPGIIAPDDADAALLTRLYDTVDNAEAWPAFLQGLGESSFFNRTALNLHDAVIRTGTINAQANFDPALIDMYARHYAALNPWLAQPEKRPLGTVLTSEVVVPYAELLKTEWYNDFCRPLGIELAVGLTVQHDGARSMVVSAMGRRHDLERDRHIVRRMRFLAPHLLRVAQLNRQLDGLKTRTAAAEAGLDRLSVAVLVADAAGHVVYLNAMAEQVVAAQDGPVVVRRMLDAVKPAEGQALRHLVATALQAMRDIRAAPGGIMRITRRSGRMPYEVLVTPLSGTSLALGFTGPLAAVFIRDPETRAVAPIVWLQRLYALTNAEARLMQALLAGHTLDAFAEQAHLSKETLRSQLKSVFLKTGTRSQLALLRLGLRGLGAFQP